MKPATGTVGPRFQPSVTPPRAPDADCRWLAFREERLLVERRPAGAGLPCGPQPGDCGPQVLRRQFLGTLDGRPVWCAELDPGAPVPPGMEYVGLRELYLLVEEEIFRLACRATQIKDWDRDHQFCGRCGARAEDQPGERAKVCPRCGLVRYPRISPAVIVAVRREDRLLLARARRFTGRLHSVIAGFVEAGETLEECVQREVEEETGLSVRNIRYFGSQPWPFPDSLMIAFTAEHAGGEIHIDGRELVEADWFTADALPEIPGPISIARRLIDHFVQSTTSCRNGRPSPTELYSRA